MSMSPPPQNAACLGIQAPLLSPVILVHIHAPSRLLGARARQRPARHQEASSSSGMPRALHPRLCEASSAALSMLYRASFSAFLFFFFFFSFLAAHNSTWGRAHSRLGWRLRVTRLGGWAGKVGGRLCKCDVDGIHVLAPRTYIHYHHHHTYHSMEYKTHIHAYIHAHEPRLYIPIPVAPAP